MKSERARTMAMAISENGSHNRKVKPIVVSKKSTQLNTIHNRHMHLKKTAMVGGAFFLIIMLLMWASRIMHRSKHVENVEQYDDDAMLEVTDGLINDDLDA